MRVDRVTDQYVKRCVKSVLYYKSRTDIKTVDKLSENVPQKNGHISFKNNQNHKPFCRKNKISLGIMDWVKIYLGYSLTHFTA